MTGQITKKNGKKHANNYNNYDKLIFSVCFSSPIIGLEIVKSCINQKAIEDAHGDNFNISD